jgi:ankyrin repeat protein
VESYQIALTKTSARFLLARLSLDSLIDKMTELEVEEALEHMQQSPPDLDKAYNDAVNRIDRQAEGHRKWAHCVLSWLLHTRRDLTPVELRHALAVRVGDCHLEQRNLPEIAEVISLCAGLVALNRESNVVQLVHFTTRQFFEKLKVRPSWICEGLKQVARICVTYLSFREFGVGPCLNRHQLDERLSSNVLYEYAATNWGYHARDASVEQEQLVLDLLKSEAKVSACYQVMGLSKSSCCVKGVHLAAYLGLRNTIMVLLNEVDMDPKDSNGRTPLSWATENGQEAVVELLLSKAQVNVNSRDCTGRTPLWLAVENGHKATAKLLLDTGKVDINLKETEFGRTLIWWAAESRDEALVKMLLDTGKVDLNIRDTEHGRTLIWWAAESRDEALVKMLLDTGKVDLNIRDTEHGRTLLWWAVENKDEALVRRLLDTGKVDLNLRDTEYGRNPLWREIGNGDKAIIEAFLDTGILGLASRDIKYSSTLLS